MMDPPPQLYAKHLLPYRYGYPLWTPEPSNELLMRRSDGLRIGDVGVIDLENGSFDVFFNICLPPNHPLHQPKGVPDNFAPVLLDDCDIASYPHAEYPGRVISSSSVTAKNIEPTGEATVRPFTCEFNLSSSEGALLILPNGAESRKLLKRQEFREIAAQSAIDWYDFAERHLGRIITHDSLYLITGLYKTRSWSVAAFHETTGTAEWSAQFKASQAGGSNDMSYSWETMRALDWRVGPQFDVRVVAPNQSVFISGFKIAIRDGLLGKKRVEVEVDSPSVQLRSAKFPNGSTSSRPSGNLWSRLLSRNGGSGTKTTKRATTRPTMNQKMSSSLVQSDAVTPHITVDHMPRPLQSFHPSDVINRYMLTKESSASVAITHDTQWIVLLEKGLLKPEDLSQNDQLEKIISENYRLISQEGTVYLQAIWDSSIRLRDINDAMYEAWKEDKLDDAEEILSRYTFRHTDSDYYVFAIRALIRARLYNWDAALRDAETSINIQPSVVAHVAKGFALFGKGKYEFAMKAFSVAIQQCDVDDREIVSLIKFIVLFEVGYHAESMAGIANLIECCSVEVKPACSLVQAAMYIRQAALATKKEDHSKALQILMRTRSLEQFQVHEVPDLKIITLICGWRFDDIPLTVCRQECETLLLLGCIDEAVESFRTIGRDIGEDVRANKDNTEWIASFSHQCLTALETLGDSAMSSQNYNDAITRYSTAIGMGPVTREHFLTKRSKAYTASHAWDLALKDANEAIDLSPLSLPGHESKHQALHGMGRYEESNQTFDRMVSIAMFKSSADTQTHYTYLRVPHENHQLARTTEKLSTGLSNSSNLPHISPERTPIINPERMAQLRDLDSQAKSTGQNSGVIDQLSSGSDMIAQGNNMVLRDHLSSIPSTLSTSGKGNQGARTMSLQPHALEQADSVVQGVEESVPPQKHPESMATLPQLLHNGHTQRSYRPLTSTSADPRDTNPVDNRHPQASPASSSSRSSFKTNHVPHTTPIKAPAHPPTIVRRTQASDEESNVDSLIVGPATEHQEDIGLSRRPRTSLPTSDVHYHDYLDPIVVDRSPPSRQSWGLRRHSDFSRRSEHYRRESSQIPDWYQVPRGERMIPPVPPSGAFTQPPMYSMISPTPESTYSPHFVDHLIRLSEAMTRLQVLNPLHGMLVEILREQHSATVSQQEDLMGHMLRMNTWMMREIQERPSGMTSQSRIYDPSRLGEPGSMHTPSQAIPRSHSARSSSSSMGPPPSYRSTPYGISPSPTPFGPTSSSDHVSHSLGTTLSPYHAPSFNSAPHSGPANPPGRTSVTHFAPSEPELILPIPIRLSPPHELMGDSEHVRSPASSFSSPPGVTIEPPTPGGDSNPPSPSQALATPIENAFHSAPEKAISPSGSSRSVRRLSTRSWQKSPISELQSPTDEPTAYPHVEPAYYPRASSYGHYGRPSTLDTARMGVYEYEKGSKSLEAGMRWTPNYRSPLGRRDSRTYYDGVS